ncbi:MAG: hypothetical protein HZA63_09370 [Rhodocyclales bacterium]|nr:hypothetical protein [Rhodocyclales bacterium]
MKSEPRRWQTAAQEMQKAPLRFGSRALLVSAVAGAFVVARHGAGCAAASVYSEYAIGLQEQNFAD